MGDKRSDAKKAAAQAWIIGATTVFAVLGMGFVIMNRTAAADMKTQERLVDMNRRLMDVESASAKSIDSSIRLWELHDRLAQATAALHDAHELVLVGKIIAADIEANTYVLSIGEDQGVLAGQGYSVRRAGREVTRLEITDAGKAQATGAVLSPNDAPRIKSGDVVVLVEQAPEKDE